MLHLIKKMTVLSFLTIALGATSQVYALDSGALLMCVNDQGNWTRAFWEPMEWRRRSTAADWLSKDKVATQQSSGAVWLYGIPGNENSNNPSLRLMDSEGKALDFPKVSDKYQRSAKDYCAALKKICTDRNGDKYRYIGVSAADLGVKGTLIATISMYQDGQVYTCPNWRVSHAELSDTDRKYHVTCMDPDRTSAFSQVHGTPNIWSNGTKNYNTLNSGKKVAAANEYTDANLLFEQIAQPYCAGK